MESALGTAPVTRDVTQRGPCARPTSHTLGSEGRKPRGPSTRHSSGRGVTWRAGSQAAAPSGGRPAPPRRILLGSWKTTEEIKWKHKSATQSSLCPPQARAPTQRTRRGLSTEAPASRVGLGQAHGMIVGPRLPAAGPVTPSGPTGPAPPQEDVGCRAGALPPASPCNLKTPGSRPGKFQAPPRPAATVPLCGLCFPACKMGPQAPPIPTSQAWDKEREVGTSQREVLGPPVITLRLQRKPPGWEPAPFRGHKLQPQQGVPKIAHLWGAIPSLPSPLAAYPSERCPTELLSLRGPAPRPRSDSGGRAAPSAVSGPQHR